jgi:hypothetical protein
MIENEKNDPEIVRVQIVQSDKSVELEFMYRFIKFRLNFETKRFEPVVFDCIHDPIFLKHKYGRGIQTEREIH